MKNIVYPTAEKIVEYNALALNLLKVKKADKPEVLSGRKIIEIVDSCRETKGDLYDKAVTLLKGLIQNHPFASGNRRTAFVVAKDFVLSNKGKFKIKDDPRYAKVMQGIREGYYNDEELKEWIKNGKIREFRR
jgi:death-on-curing family protein